MTSAAVSPHRQRRQPRRTIRLLLTVVLLLALLAPVAYLFEQLWVSAGDAGSHASTDRIAAAYARPLTRLLSALVDAQTAAARNANIDTAPVRNAVDDINDVDRRYPDPLTVRDRWKQLSQEIDNALGQKSTGAEALRTYAVPIGLAEALLDRIGEDAKVTQDPGLGAYRLVEAGLEDLPEVTVEAGRLDVLSRTADSPGTPTKVSRGATAIDPRLTTAADRMARAAGNVTTGLRGGGDATPTYPVDLSLLQPLDEFAAAADELTQAANALENPTSAVRARLDTAQAGVQRTALTLETAILDAFDNQLNTRGNHYTSQRRILVGLGVVIVLAAGGLLWLRVPAPAAPVPVPSEGADDLYDAARFPAEPEEPKPEPIPDLVDARDLLAPELVHVGRAVRARKRQERDDPR
jgi:hypothetical protein